MKKTSYGVMQEQPKNRQCQTIDVAANDFSDRLNQFSAIHNTSTGPIFSRLALIHRVAKAYGSEAVNESGFVSTDLEIEEITNPPLYDQVTDEPVVIRFSY